jgi:hypothetical protein
MGASKFILPVNIILHWQVECSCEHSSEPSGPVKCWRLLKKGSPPWSYLVMNKPI